MNITYRDTQKFKPEELQGLFLSVGWLVGNEPEKLAAAMEYSDTVFSAWDEGRLVGLIKVLDDNTMTAYIHFLLVNPAEQGQGIGKELMRMVMDKYKDYLRIVLTADESETGFYENCGFKHAEATAVMLIDNL